MNKKYNGFDNDPDNISWVLCWAILRGDPWHLHSVHVKKEEAVTLKKSMGNDLCDYEIVQGTHEKNSDNFIYTDLSTKAV